MSTMDKINTAITVLTFVALIGTSVFDFGGKQAQLTAAITRLENTINGIEDRMVHHEDRLQSLDTRVTRVETIQTLQNGKRVGQQQQ